MLLKTELENQNNECFFLGLMPKTRLQQSQKTNQKMETIGVGRGDWI